MIVKNVEKQEKSTVTFDVLCDAAEFEKAVNAAYLKNRGKIFVPGFRKGKAPRMVIEGMYGKDVFYDDAADVLAPEAFNFAVDQEGLRTVGTPAVKDMNVSDAKELTLSFTTAVWPEVTLGEYKGLKAPKAKVEITDERLAEEIEKIRKRNSRIVSVERPAQDGDTAVIDYEGSVDGVPFDGGKAEGHNLVLGSGAFIPGFEEQVVGMSAGEERDITVTFPEEYAEASLAGKEAVFHIKCNEVKENQMPDLDDEFAKEVSEFDTLDEYKASVKERLEKAAEEDATSAFQSALIEQAGDNMTADIPEAMVQEQIDGIMREQDQQLRMSGLSLEMYLKYVGQDVSAYRQSVRPQAERRAKTDVVLEAVAEAEGIKPTDEEVEQEYADVAKQYSMTLEDVKKALAKELIEANLRTRKAAQLIFDAGVATEPEDAPAGETPKKDEEKAEDAPAEAKPKKAAAKKATKKAGEKTMDEAGEGDGWVKEDAGKAE